MKNLLTLTLSTLVLSTTGCASNQSTSKTSFKGRVIEFKSGNDGFDTRTFFYEAENEVVAFDSQFTPELAEKSIQHLRTFTSKPISWLVITHPNPDKFNGISAFKREGAKVIASEKTARNIPKVHSYKEYFFVEIAKTFQKGQYPKLETPDQTFQSELNIILKGGETVSLKELELPGVSTNQTVAYIPTLNSLFVGDLLHYKAHAWLEGPIIDGQPQPDLNTWISDLKELVKLYPKDATVFGGRGQTVNLLQGAQDQIAYLKSSELIITRFLKSELLTTKDFAGPEASLHYKRLATVFEREFPSYELSYMIEYGAYGLVLKLLHSRGRSTK